MTLFIDADGCPVVRIAVAAALRCHVSCCLVCDTAHEIFYDGVETVVVDQGADSADYALAARVRPGDVVITQDYGLASICLAKRARILHQDGWEYTSDNIDALLFSRHTARKIRASGGHLKGPARRKPEQDRAFSSALEQLLQTAVQG